jgi:hypothetical protein
VRDPEQEFPNRTPARGCLIARRAARAADRRRRPEIGGAGSAGFLVELKSDPGRLGRKTLLGEIDKLERVKATGRPPGRL